MSASSDPTLLVDVVNVAVVAGDWPIPPCLSTSALACIPLTAYDGIPLMAYDAPGTVKVGLVYS
jgi:hypothetical protein